MCLSHQLSQSPWAGVLLHVVKQPGQSNEYCLLSGYWGQAAGHMAILHSAFIRIRSSAKASKHLTAAIK